MLWPAALAMTLPAVLLLQAHMRRQGVGRRKMEIDGGVVDVNCLKWFLCCFCSGGALPQGDDRFY